ncbi:hypothetical protein HWI77_03355 [Acinetobacter venetianus]|jgi:hypothetical protein|uniref:CheW-like domain-containing protein n=2 Tax=Acinetobacter venetianus TaxID=52133 RepID=N8YNW5_ACIVR|nr:MULTISPECIES: hypothetical protein [Acinetobacter]ENV38396.1 hypothetical protein F959_00452 [Acinetobacter venetianus RAG-1 = CIP 110063]ERP96186.1 hypothetical protein Q674_05315 [Acinetobacter sp. COS3]KXO82927.1 hypothetical protein AYL20_02790 [Acinetobacter venetianus]KXZ64394.1 hypothetical protein AVENLUH8758_02792 [Acinetobacter venetianus]KXZ66629.1 hypothetical protein AVENLUH5627_02497 [Acinetobacter venetianus]|tara:strand:- start:262 stop:717 length:456 start_codon:yes stop_codon:yes gene_type:complete
MAKKSANSTLGQIDQQELQHLITVSTGFIDAYIIECHQNVPMLLPQNIVLSAMDTQTDADYIEWHDLKLPVFSVNDPSEQQGVALVIEGDDVSERFALVCNEMPESIRLRISEIVDEERDIADQNVFKYVKMGDKQFYVPDLQNIQKKLGL